jgi:P-type Ca2+ transporter type 2C
MAEAWHSLSLNLLYKKLGTSEKGLTSAEAEKRLSKFGPNVLAEEKGVSLFSLFFSQFANLLTIILLLATGVSFLLGDVLESLIILAIVFFSAVLGFVQEYRSQEALSALKKMASSTAHVLRDSQPQKIPALEVVPGDIILLNWGDKVPADARLISELDLGLSEAVLTGESMPVKKEVMTLKSADMALAERKNMVFSGTIVAKGKGQALVVATGMETEFGRIAKLLGEVEKEETPLEKKLESVGRLLGIGSLVICTVTALLGIWRGYDLLEMLIWGVSLAVAAVPEALPAVVTGSLSLGVWEMAKKKAIVRRLPAVETLGSVSCICSDKTGTLTRNEMTVRRVVVRKQDVFVEGVGYQPEGGFLAKDKKYSALKDKDFQKLVKIASLCNDAYLNKKGKGWVIDGDPTEGALVVLGAKAGLNKKTLEKKYPRLEEIPFEMDRKRMSTVHKLDNGLQLLLKGAPESVLQNCKFILKNGKKVKLTSSMRGYYLKTTSNMAENALRVLGFAYRDLNKSQTASDKKISAQTLEKDLVFVGLAGMIDPARDEAAEAILTCKKAGIKPIIITGDHKLTTFAVGRDLGLFESQDEIITSDEIKNLSAKDFSKIVDKKSYARVSPEDKLRIVSALQKKGYLVAMTGDGVNDAPALKKADIGIAMGIAGTDVAKEASDMVLADDNFATIVEAIKKGREIYDNIKKYLFYLLRCNVGEILVLGGGFLLGLPQLMTAIQILWINLVTDGLPALALGVDPSDKGVMKRKPLNPEKSIFSKKSVSLMFILALNMGFVLLPQFAFLLKNNMVLLKAQTIVFITMVLMEMLNAYNSKTDGSLFKINPFNNKWLNLAVLSSLLATLAIVEVPGLARIFGTTVLKLSDWGMAIGLSLSALAVGEIAKILLAKVKFD